MSRVLKQPFNTYVFVAIPKSSSILFVFLLHPGKSIISGVNEQTIGQVRKPE